MCVFLTLAKMKEASLMEEEELMLYLHLHLAETCRGPPRREKVPRQGTFTLKNPIVDKKIIYICIY